VIEMRNAYKIKEKLKERYKFIHLCIYGDNIKMELKGIG
jgi:hypothetical protein